jgi:hypothetical protein
VSGLAIGPAAKISRRRLITALLPAVSNADTVPCELPPRLASEPDFRRREQQFI